MAKFDLWPVWGPGFAIFAVPRLSSGLKNGCPDLITVRMDRDDAKRYIRSCRRQDPRYRYFMSEASIVLRP